MPIVIPDEILEGSGLTVEDIRLDVAISLYQREKVSLGKAAEIAGMNRWEFQKELAERKIPTINYSVEDLERELKALSSLK